MKLSVEFNPTKWRRRAKLFGGFRSVTQNIRQLPRRLGFQQQSPLVENPMESFMAFTSEESLNVILSSSDSFWVFFDIVSHAQIHIMLPRLHCGDLPQLLCKHLFLHLICIVLLIRLEGELLILGLHLEAIVHWPITFTIFKRT